ncbi:MAG: acetolactate synthase small subunit [Rikenellaceae bacterium]
MESKNLYTITIYTENQVGLLSQIALMFTRRKLNIENLSVSASAEPGVHKFTILLECSERSVKNVVSQIDKRVDVIRAFYYLDCDIFTQEIALYKVSTPVLMSKGGVSEIVNRFSVRILEFNEAYTIIEKSGSREKIQMLYDELSDYNMLQFSRSGRVSITRSKVEEVSLFLEEQEARRVKNE